ELDWYPDTHLQEPIGYRVRNSRLPIKSFGLGGYQEILGIGPEVGRNRSDRSLVNVLGIRRKDQPTEKAVRLANEGPVQIRDLRQSCSRVRLMPSCCSSGSGDIVYVAANVEPQKGWGTRAKKGFRP